MYALPLKYNSIHPPLVHFHFLVHIQSILDIHALMYEKLLLLVRVCVEHLINLPPDFDEIVLKGCWNRKIKHASILPKKTRFSEEPMQHLKNQIQISTFPRRGYIVYENGLQRCILNFVHRLLLHFFSYSLLFRFPMFFTLCKVVL